MTIGGQETLDSRESIPENAWVLSRHAFEKNLAATRHTVGFTQGVPTVLDGESMGPVKLIEALETLAGPCGIGRGIHVGDTVLGTKGRVAFEAPLRKRSWSRTASSRSSRCPGCSSVSRTRWPRNTEISCTKASSSTRFAGISRPC